MYVLSPLFDIKPTLYGGRGCFANQDIPVGTTVLECPSPYSSSVLRSFKKEVCSWCFHYENGSNLKFKMKDLSNFYFCSQKCVEEFQNYDTDGIYLVSIGNAEVQYLRLLKNRKTNDLEGPESKRDTVIKADIVNCSWKEIEEWEAAVFKMKPQKRLNKLPKHIDENELMELKYAVGCLFELYRQDNSIGGDEEEDFETLNKNIFEELQSDELLKLFRYPYLLESYTRVYKLLRLSLVDELQRYLTVGRFRDIIGKNLSNAFGIWSEGRSDREFFGYSVYPTASFFNHSCAANLARKRSGRTLTFKSKSEIKNGQEICISYGNASDEDLLTRQEELNEWHFKCLCIKCVEDFDSLKVSSLAASVAAAVL